MSQIAVNLFSESLSDFGNVSIIEESIGDARQCYIEGIFAQADLPNRNGRVYPQDVLFPDIERYINERVERKVAWGELDHPPERVQVNAKEASHLITNLWFEGSNVMGKALILDTPNGNIIKAMMKAGGQPCVSTRGLGKAEENAAGIQEMKAFHLTAIDVVSFPSGIDCFVRGMHESLEFLVESDLLSKNAAYKIMKEDNKRIASRDFSLFVQKILKGTVNG